jgi:ubiquitin C-terminal hydrolase
MNQLKCQKCGYSSYAFDNFMDLSISIPRSGVRITGQVELKDCMESFIKPEKMEPCGFKCTRCHGVDNFTKDLSIFRFPKILVVHLKRFYNSAMRREKLNTSVRIPTIQDFSKFAPNSSRKIFEFFLIFI